MDNYTVSDDLIAGLGDMVGSLVSRAKEVTGGPSGIDDHQPMVFSLAEAVARLEQTRALHELVGVCRDNNYPALGFVQCVLASQVVEQWRRLHFAYPDMCASLQLEPQNFTRSMNMDLLSQMQALNLGSVMNRQHLFGLADTNRGLLEVAEPHDLGDVVQAAQGFLDEYFPGDKALQIHQGDLLLTQAQMRGMAEAGIFSGSISEEDGGSGLGFRAMLLMTMQLARTSFAAAASPLTRFEIAAGMIKAVGTVAQKTEWLPKLASGEIVPAICATEPNVGSDIKAVSLFARVEDGYLVIDEGSKTWSTMAGIASHLLVLVRTSNDPADVEQYNHLTAVLIPKEQIFSRQPTAWNCDIEHGGTISGEVLHTQAYRGMGEFELHFQNVKIPMDWVVGGEEGIGKGFRGQMAAFSPGRLQTAARVLGLCWMALSATLDRTSTRQQFGQSIDSFGRPIHLLGGAIAAYSTNLYLAWKAAGMYQDAEMALSAAGTGDRRAAQAKLRDVQGFASMTKFIACMDVRDIILPMMRLYGADGQEMGTPMPMALVEAILSSIFEGAEDTVGLMVVGRSILSN